MMVAIVAYLVLVAIWSTTPLAIKWSALEISFAGAIFWRILLSALLALLIIFVRRETLWCDRLAVRYYVVAALGIAPNFLLVYWASLSISSGLISVIFSITPFVMGVLSYYMLGKQVFTLQRVCALCMAVVGLVIVFSDQLDVVGAQGGRGLLAMIASVLLFSLSSTYLQKIDAAIPTLQKTTGGLCFSVPLLAIAWWFLDGQMPWPLTLRTSLSVLYLSVFGSLIGFAIYYYLLHRLSAYTVSTVGMISPVFALFLGYSLADEVIGLRLLVGAGLVLLGVALYYVQLRVLLAYCLGDKRIK